MLNKTHINKKRIKQERGVFLLFIALGLALLIGVLAFAIDIPQKEVISQEVRLAVDAASLAGAQQLNSTVAGLNAAVLSAEQTMDMNKVAGEPVPVNKYSIELGFYSFSDKEFRKLASGADYRDPNALPLEHYSEAPLASIVNAVRVVANATSPSIFSRIYGFFNMGVVEGASVATANKNPKVCAVPFAIPLCSLFLNQDPNRPNNFITEEFEAEAQCKRPLFITNAEYEHELFFRDQRLAGVFRASLYAKPQSVAAFQAGNYCAKAAGSSGVNCIMQPLMGTFIVPSARDVFGNGEILGDDGDGVATPFEVMRLLDEMRNLGRDLSKTDGRFCMHFQMGETVVPLDYAQMVKEGTGAEPESILAQSGAGKTYSADDVDKIFYDIIYGVESKNFVDVFGSPRSGSSKIAQENYPYLRDQAQDRSIGMGENEVMTPAMGSWEWTNPLCHTPQVKGVGGGTVNLLANDQNNARVQTVTVPVIIPERSQVEGQFPPTRYCDPDTQVGNSNLLLYDPPRSDTGPQIVGFVEVNLIDFNFRWLKNEGVSFPRAEPRPNYVDEAGRARNGQLVQDSNPVGGRP